MEQVDNSTKKAKWKQLDYKRRIQIEALRKARKNAYEIAELLGCSKRTVERELKRGSVDVWHTKYDPIAIAACATKRERICSTEYCAEAAQAMCVDNASRKGKQLKIGKNFAFAKYIEAKIIKDRFSPYAALAQAKLDNMPFAGLICVKTLYNYIDNDVFLDVTNKNLWVKRHGKKREYCQVRPAHNNRKGRSIENRDKSILSREEQGHWEMDTVYGKGKCCLFVLTERKSKKELVIKLKSRTQKEVIKALDRQEKRMGAALFRKTFKTITVDNGGEFLNQKGIEKSCINSKKPRTIVYYCHPFSSWERGSNENQNKLIRRFIPKGANISKYSEKEIQKIEDYMNNLPRQLFGGYPPNSIYQATA